MTSFQDEVYKFTNKVRVEIKENIAVIKYKNKQKRIQLEIRYGEYSRPVSREVLPYKLMAEISRSFKAEGQECIEKALNTAVDQVYGAIICKTTKEKK